LLPLFGYGQNKYYGTFTGSGSGLTNLNPANISTNGSTSGQVLTSSGGVTSFQTPIGGVPIGGSLTNVYSSFTNSATGEWGYEDTNGVRLVSNSVSGVWVWYGATNVIGGVGATTNYSINAQTGVITAIGSGLTGLNYVASTNGVAYGTTIYNPATNIWTVLTVATNYVVSDGTNLYHVDASTNGVFTNEIMTIKSGNVTWPLNNTNTGTLNVNGNIIGAINNGANNSILYGGTSKGLNVGGSGVYPRNSGDAMGIFGTGVWNFNANSLIASNTVTATNGFASYATHIPNAVSVGASPYSFTNTISVALECYFSDAAAYTLAKNGTTVLSGLTGDDYFVMQPGSYFTLTYSSTTPTVNTNAW
jgi:hypothetical protein